MDTVTSEPPRSPAAEGVEDEGTGEGATGEGACDGGAAQEGSPGLLTSALPYCHNRAIASIMGSPCSDDEEDEEDEDDEDNDGLDSECSSEVSDSDCLCRTRDPYDLRNFTAPTTTARRPVPSPDPSPDSPPDPGTVSLSPPGSPPGLQHLDSWDDSTSAREAEGGDRRCLWSSSSSDPPSLLDFQTPVRTGGPLAEVQEEDGSRDQKKSLKTPPRDEAEDRLDSGLSEPPARAAATAVTSQREVFKKVRFCEEVEEFSTSSREDEDRRGQWEELARDRHRFSRRCRDVEQRIAYCWEPLHRTLMLQRITAAGRPES